MIRKIKRFFAKESTSNNEDVIIFNSLWIKIPNRFEMDFEPSFFKYEKESVFNEKIYELNNFFINDETLDFLKTNFWQ